MKDINFSNKFKREFNWINKSILSNILSRKKVESFEKYLFFIGTPRSGHSMVSKVLDSSSEVVITNELNIFRLKRLFYFPEKILQRFIFNEYGKHEYKESPKGGGYSLKIKNLFQGKYNTIKYIGDKKAAGTTIEYIKDRTTFESMSKPLVFVNVVRNPFDNITTIYIKSKTRELDYEKRKGLKLDKEILKDCIEVYFQLIGGAEEFSENHKVYNLKFEDILVDPKKEFKKLFDNLGLSVTEENLNSYKNLVRKPKHNSRDSIVWPEDLIAMVEMEMEKYKTLSGYTFKDKK